MSFVNYPIDASVSFPYSYAMISKDKIHSAMDAYQLYQRGELTLRKSLFRSCSGITYKLIRFENTMGSLKMFVEMPNGHTDAIGTTEIRNMKLEIVPKNDITCEKWIDPA